MDFKNLINKIDSLSKPAETLTESVIAEKAESKAQQKAAGAALAAKKSGDTSKLKGASKEMAKMSKKELEKVAGTKHKGLPEKKTDESIEEAASWMDPLKAAQGKGTGTKQDPESERNRHKPYGYRSDAKTDDDDSDAPKAKKKAKKESIDTEQFKAKFDKMVEAKKGSKPDFLDLDGDGDTEEPMKKAAADKKKGAIGKKKVDETQLDELSSDTLKSYKDKTSGSVNKRVDPTASKAEVQRKDRNQRAGNRSASDKLIKKDLDGAFESKKTSKKTVKESVEQKLTFRDMMKLVVESGGQQQIDPVDQELFAWATRVAQHKLGEGMKAEVYAGLVYERMGGVFEMYDVLSEDKE